MNERDKLEQLSGDMLQSQIELEKQLISAEVKMKRAIEYLERNLNFASGYLRDQILEDVQRILKGEELNESPR